MFFKLFLLFTATPLIELALLIKLGEIFGFLHTFTMVIITGAIGAWLARSQGIKVVNEFRQSVQNGEMPADPLIEGLMIVVGGAFLVTPGVITDIAGFTLVIPFTRKIMRRFVKRYLGDNLHVSKGFDGTQGFYYTNGNSEFDHRVKETQHDDDDVIDV